MPAPMAFKSGRRGEQDATILKILVLKRKGFAAARAGVAVAVRHHLRREGDGRLAQQLPQA